MKNIKSANSSYTGDVDFTKTSNWNNAEEYSRQMIGRHFLSADKLKEIARFGSLDLENSIIQNLPKQIVVRARYNAIERYYYEIETIIENSFFALRSKDKPVVTEIRKNLILIKPLIKKVFNKSGGKEAINEAVFDLIFTALRKLMEELKDPINKSDLIFGHDEEFDPLAQKEAIKENLINVG